MEHILFKDLEENFRWHGNQQVSSVLLLQDLLDQDAVERHLERLVNECGSVHKAHAASMTAKRAGYAAALMIYSRIEFGVQAVPTECRLLTVEEHGTNPGWFPYYSFPFHLAPANSPPAEWITEVLYKQTLVPIVERLSKVKGMSRIVLYENIFVYIYWILNTKLQCRSLYGQLIETAASLYGCQKKLHPLAFFDKTPEATRKTCCLHYQTCDTNIKPCKTCPIQKI